MLFFTLKITTQSIIKGAIIVAFGRHRGKDLKTIFNEDPRYVDWLLSPNGVEDSNAREKMRDFISEFRI